MKYYERHLGDYLRDTMHLSMIEDGAYSRLMDAYYSREQPLPRSLQTVYRIIRAETKQDKTAVKAVLKEFFVAKDDGYHHERCNQELARYQEKRRKAQGSANARWKSCDGNANALRTHCDGNALQSPITNHKNSDDLKVDFRRKSLKESLPNILKRVAP